MPKTIDSAEITKKLEKAKLIRDEAEAKAKEIEADILTDLKEEKKNLLEQVAQLDKEIEKISGKPVATGGNSGKGKRQKLELTILEIVKDHGPVSCAAIESHPKMIEFYSPDQVPSQAVKLKSLDEAKKLKKAGERKKAVYSLA